VAFASPALVLILEEAQMYMNHPDIQEVVTRLRHLVLLVGFWSFKLDFNFRSCFFRFLKSSKWRDWIQIFGEKWFVEGSSFQGDFSLAF
jgi:hypothetical protein